MQAPMGACIGEPSRSTYLNTYPKGAPDIQSKTLEAPSLQWAADSGYPGSFGLKIFLAWQAELKMFFTTTAVLKLTEYRTLHLEKEVP